MQSSAWAAILRRIPPDQHDSLAIVTTVGVEISIQDVLRIEDDHIVMRGRLSGTTQSGRAFFVPYDQINYLGFQKEVRVAQIMALYSEAPAAEHVESKAATLSAQPAVIQPATTDAAPAAVAQPSPVAELPLEPPKPGQLKLPRRSGLIDRLRARALLGPKPEPPSDP
jgi:hypothetical protein